MNNNQKEEIKIALINQYGFKKANYLLNLIDELINKPVETTNEQPETYCKAKSELNNPGLPDCNCHNFCKFDNIQFDTSLG